MAHSQVAIGVPGKEGLKLTRSNKRPLPQILWVAIGVPGKEGLKRRSALQALEREVRVAIGVPGKEGLKLYQYAFACTFEH